MLVACEKSRETEDVIVVLMGIANRSMVDAMGIKWMLKQSCLNGEHTVNLVEFLGYSEKKD